MPFPIRTHCKVVHQTIPLRDVSKKCVWCKLVRYTERVHHVRDMQEFGHLLNPEKEQGAHDQTPRAGLKKPPEVEVIEVVDEEKAKGVAEVKV